MPRLLPFLLLFIFSCWACTKEGGNDQGLDQDFKTNCEFRPLEVKQGLEFPEYIEMDGNRVWEVQAFDTLIIVKYFERASSNIMRPYQTTHYRRFAGRSYQIVDSVFGQNMIRFSAVRNYRDSVVISTTQRPLDAWEPIRLSERVFHIDYQGSPSLEIRRSPGINGEVRIHYNYGDSPNEGIYNPEWKWIGLASPFLPSLSQGVNGIYHQYEYHFDEQNRLASYTRSEHDASNTSELNRQCFSVNYQD